MTRLPKPTLFAKGLLLATALSAGFTMRAADPEPEDSTYISDDMEKMLDAVTVTAQKPLITKEIDRIGYDVQADSEAKTSQLNEILKKVPLVSVDDDGTIRVKGSTSFKIYKNGRPNNSFSRNAKEIFKALPASMIKRIEVITDPGAREDAEGTSAILNIVTLENTIIKGVMGSVSLDYTRFDDSPGTSLWVQTQIDKLNLSAYGGYRRMSRAANRGSNESLQKYEDSGNELYSEASGDSHGQLGYFGLEGSLELDTLNLLTAELNGYSYTFHSNRRGTTRMTGADGSLIYSYATNSLYSPNRYTDIDGGINYQRSTRRKGETLTLSYRISTTNQHQINTTEYDDEVNLPVPYTGTSNDFTLDFIEHTGQFDWTRPINQSNKFDIGAKYINRNNHSVNDQDYFNWRTEHSDFSHNTQVLALYGDYRLKWRKLGARAGLRYEYSRLSAKFRDGSNAPFHSNLSDWVPNASVSYDFDRANTLKLSYSTRISRPGISQLNPAVVESPSSISTGNPDLGSARRQTLSLNYTLMSRKISVEVSSSYGFCNNAIIGVQELTAGDILKSWYANAGHNRWANFGLWMNYTPWMKTSMMINANADYNKVSNPSAGLRGEGWGGNVYFRVQQRLPKDFSITGFISTYVQGPGLYDTQEFSFADQSNWGVNLQKSLLKEQRLNLSLNITNPFGPSKRRYTSTPRNSGYTGYTTSYRHHGSNIFRISATYRFGKLNAQVKKTASGIKNDDVENRRN